MGTFIFNVLKNFDIYGFKFPLRYKQETEYSTICGIIFSLMSISLISTISFFYILEIINKSNFTLVTNYIYSENNIEINFSDYPFMFGLYNYEKPIEIDNSYVTFRLDRNIYTPTKDNSGYSILERTSIPIEIEKCTLNSFNNYTTLFEQYEYNINLCVKPNQNLTIKGRHGDQVKGYEVLELHLIRCENSTSNSNICKSSKEIDDYLENSFIALFYISQNANHFNVKNPITTGLNSDTFSITLKHVKRYYYFFDKAIYNTDNGLMLNENKKFDLFQYHHTHFDFVEKETQNYYSDKTLLEINFSCHDLKTEYIRSYIKLQDVLSNIGGIFDIISTIFAFISHNFVQKSFNIGIGGTFVSSNCKSLNNLNSKNSDFSNQKILKIQNRCSVSSIPLKSKILENTHFCTLFNVDIKNHILEMMEIKNEHLKIIEQFEKHRKTLFFYFCYFIYPNIKCKYSKKFQSYNLYKNIYERLMSIDFLIPMILQSYQSINTEKKCNIFN